MCITRLTRKRGRSGEERATGVVPPDTPRLPERARRGLFLLFLFPCYTQNYVKSHFPCFDWGGGVGAAIVTDLPPPTPGGLGGGVSPPGHDPGG